MKKPPKAQRREADDVRLDYRFDYSHAKPNRFAPRMRRPVFNAPPALPVGAAHDGCAGPAPRHLRWRTGSDRRAVADHRATGELQPVSLEFPGRLGIGMEGSPVRRLLLGELRTSPRRHLQPAANEASRGWL